MRSSAPADSLPNEDSATVRRLRAAGAIVVGKTNLPEMGILPVSEPLRFGPARNPWDTSRTPGGSSGGSAAGVAAGMVAIAHGNDGGGSIRIPASCCGLVGLKPSRGRVSWAPHLAELAAGFATDGVLTRSVLDSALGLDLLAGYEPGDPYWAPDPSAPFVDAVGREPGRLRVAFVVDSPNGVPVAPDCGAATPPIEIGALEPKEDEPPVQMLMNAGQWVPFTPVWNVTGQPAISLPLHQTDAGLPVGVQLVGPPAGEELLLSLAAQIEAAEPWADRRPALAVA